MCNAAQAEKRNLFQFKLIFFPLLGKNIEGNDFVLKLSAPSSPSQVLLSSPTLHQLLLSPLTTSPTMTPEPPLLILKWSPPPLLRLTPRPNRPTRPTVTCIPQLTRSQTPALHHLQSSPPRLPPTRSLNRNLSPRALGKKRPLLSLPPAPPPLPPPLRCPPTRPPTSVTGTLTRWRCWGGRCLFSRWEVKTKSLIQGFTLDWTSVNSSCCKSRSVSLVFLQPS